MQPRHLLLFLLLFTAPLTGENNDDELLFARRIVEFWKERDYGVVKQQTLRFLEDYPESTFGDSFLAMLGDAYWHEYDYVNALVAYRKIQDENLKSKTYNNRLDCLYHLGNNKALIAELKPVIKTIGARPSNVEEELYFYYYAEALLKAAKETTNLAHAEKYRKQARRYYKALIDTQHQTNALLGLAEIDRLEGNSNSAIDTFRDLADKHPEKREELLYQAARLQASTAPEEALSTLSEVQQMGGDYRHKAALAKLHLLYDQKQYDKIINEKDQLADNLPTEYHDLLKYYLGHSYFAANRAEEAEETLTPLTSETANLKPPQKKITAMTLIAITYRKGDLPKLERQADAFAAQYPNDPLLVKAHYIRSLAYKQQHQPLKALAYMEKVLIEFPAFDSKEHAEFERNALLYDNKKWSRARTEFQNFLAKYPNSRYAATAVQYIPKSTQMLQQETGDDLTQQLIGDLEFVLNHNGMPDSQRPAYLINLAKAYYDSGNYDKTINILQNTVQRYPKAANRHKAHLLSAMAYLQGPNDEEQFIRQAENALKVKPDIANANALHHQLFNAYIRRAKAIPKEMCSQTKTQRDYLLGRAAEHLYFALSQDPDHVPDTNKLWLAYYYYDQVKNRQNSHHITPLTDPRQQAYARRAIDAYHEALKFDEKNAPPRISKAEMTLEQPLFNLSTLYGWLGNNEKQEELLNHLAIHHQTHPLWPWKLQAHVAFAQGCCQQRQGQIAEALAAYELLQKQKDPSLAAAIKLQEARARYATVSEAELSTENPAIKQAMTALRDLRTHRRLIQEPTHLEAAIDYAHISAALADDDKKKQRFLEMLQETKQEFAGKESIWAKDYQTSRELYPEKETLYQAYMTLIDAHIAGTEALLEKDSPTAHQKRQVAQELYKKIAQGEYALTPYLVHEAENGLNTIEKDS
ncbi:MAG: tetratricopeptide repeat protein [Chlamydiia bacterium]|nr:tetratricopeptide repeat protein [Chlamydiia bacterium]